MDATSTYSLAFAPHDSQTVWEAWQVVIKTISSKDCTQLIFQGLLMKKT